jgi:hypothetical protein
VKLPNAEKAVVDIAKLQDYCLNAEHFRGQLKARVFASALGLTAADAVELQTVLLDVVQTVEASARETDEFGQRFTADFTMERRGRRAQVRSNWIVRVGEDFPRLTSCFVI